MCGAPDNCATQMSLTLTLSRQRERELEGDSAPAIRQRSVRRRDLFSSSVVLTGAQHRILFCSIGREVRNLREVSVS
jgi:hypothetical protein